MNEDAKGAYLGLLDGISESVGCPLQVFEAVVFTFLVNRDGKGAKGIPAFATSLRQFGFAIAAIWDPLLLVREVKALVDMTLSLSHR